jgi:hypothetical protein
LTRPGPKADIYCQIIFLRAAGVVILPASLQDFSTKQGELSQCPSICIRPHILPGP